MTPSLATWAARRTRPSEPVRLVLGSMNFGKRTAEPEAARLVHRALERGVSMFDTANAYVDGEGERILGRALRGKRHQVLVATKVGLAREGGVSSGLLQTGGRVEGLSKRRIVLACEESLQRLGTDYVDLYFLHVPDGATPIEESLAAMAELVRAGKIRGWASSNYASWQVLEMLHHSDQQGVPRPVLSQQLYNLLVRQLDVEYFAFAAKVGLHTSIYNPLAGGLLVGHHRAGAPASGSRFDENPMYQRRYFSSALLRQTEDYRRLAQEAGLSLLSLSLRWLAARPGVDSIVLGPASVSQFDECLAAFSGSLDAELLERIESLYLAHQGTDARYARI